MLNHRMAVLGLNVRERDREATVRNKRIDFQRVAALRARAAEGAKRFAAEFERPTM
jgi:hypothetical protein